MSLGIYRQQIDEIDTQLLDLFQKRMDVVKQVAQYKIENNMQVLHPEREKEVLEMRTQQANPEYKDFAKELFSEIMRLSRIMQQDLIDQNT